MSDNKLDLVNLEELVLVNQLPLEKLDPKKLDPEKLLKEFVENYDFLTRGVRGKVISAKEVYEEDNDVTECLDYTDDALKELRENTAIDNSAAIKSLEIIKAVVKLYFT
jgi:hypothetical protein